MKPRLLMKITLFSLLFLAGFSQARDYEGYNVIANNGDVYLSRIVNGVPDIYIYKPDVGTFSSFGVNSRYGDCFLGETSLSPDGLKIAFKGGCHFPLDGDMERAPGASYRLTIMDMKTKEAIATFDHAGSFLFSPGSDKIVYAEETPGEHHLPPPPGFKGGLWMYDFKSKELSEIDTNGVGVMRLNWPPHDGNIYLTNNNKIFRYDPVTRKGALIDIPGIFFSSDGRFNLSDGMGGVKVFNVSDGKPVNYLNDSFAKLGKVALYRSWALNGDGILLTTGNGQYYIISLEDGHVVREFKGQLIGKNYKGTNFLIHPLKTDEKGRIRFDKDSLEMIHIP